MLKLMKHYVTDGKNKARVWYSRSSLINGKDCVTLYAKGYMENLSTMFPDTINDSDMQTDYMEKDKVRIYPDSPYWPRACELAERRG